MHDHQIYDAESIKASNTIPDYLERAGIILRPSPGGKKLTGCCPIHHGDNPNAFSVDAEKKVWFCFTGCQRGGDVIALDMALNGGTFADACARLGGHAPPITTARKAPAPKAPPPPPPEEDAPILSKDDLLFAARAAERLAKDGRRLERLAKARGWRPETLRNLALECSLGWDAGKLLFITERGLKGRWKENGERRFTFLAGKAGLWRRHEMELRQRHERHRAERVILTEGETDAITLIDAGAEADGKTAVIALPSATGFKPIWMPLFQGLDVILALDADTAGENASEKISAILRDTAKSIQTLNLSNQ